MFQGAHKALAISLLGRFVVPAGIWIGFGVIDPPWFQLVGGISVMDL
jgi:hypothetical protein